MKSSKQTPVGSLTILLNYDAYVFQGARLSIPLLGIDEDIPQFAQFDRLPAGVYDATLTAYMLNGNQIQQKSKVKILPNQGNLHEFRFEQPPQEVIIKPVDPENRTILFSEIKIENVDMNFRPVRNEHGLVCKIRPGEYQVNVILPNAQIKTVPLKVTKDTQVYTLMIPDKHSQSRYEPRIECNLPVKYQTSDGEWVSTETLNLSSSGVCLIKKRWYMDDENLQLRLFLPFSETPIQAPAKVRWVRDEGGLNSQMGLELHLDPKAKALLVKWLSGKTKKAGKG